MSLRILSYVQHLKGVGHVFRAKRIAEAMAARGHDVTLVLGGFEIPGLEVAGVTTHQLTPIRAGDDGYTTLVTHGDALVGEDLMHARRDTLLDLLERTQPDAILLEGFPLARRKMRFELIPMLERAHEMTPRPVVFTSARDILERPRKPERVVEAIETFERFCDCLLVHGDRQAGEVSESFPEVAKLADRTIYTGLVGPTKTQSAAATERYDIIASAGGGAVGLPLLSAAIEAKSRSAAADLKWLVLTGPNLKQTDFDLLSDLGDRHGVTVSRFHPDLRSLMAGARVSIQQAGYNTVADLLVTRCAGVLVPYAAGVETEQTVRADALEARGRVVVVREAELSQDTLAAGIDQALQMDVPEWRIDLNGAEASAIAVEQDVARRRQST
jgi:predicted glycosyltransferase